MLKGASNNSFNAEGVGNLAGEVRAQVRAAGYSRVPETELLAFGDGGSSLVDVAAACYGSRRRWTHRGTVLVIGGASQGGTVRASVTIGCGRGVWADGLPGRQQLGHAVPATMPGLKLPRQHTQSCAR